MGIRGRTAAVPCPGCGEVCWPLGYKIPVPPRRDIAAWQRLRAEQMAERDARVETAKQAEVRARHELEREIRRLEAMPDDPGRARAIRNLRRRLAGD